MFFDADIMLPIEIFNKEEFFSMNVKTPTNTEDIVAHKKNT